MRDTIDMAREAGISPAFSGHPDHPERTKDGELKYWAGVNHITLKAFEALVRADEREACAKVCDEESNNLGGVAEGPFVTDFGKHTHMSMAAGAQNCAAAIRARLKQPEQEPVATVIGKYLDRRDVLYTCIDKDLPLLTPLYTTSPTYDQGWKDGYKHGAWANTAAPVQEPVAQGVRFHERLAQNKTALEKMAAKNRHVAYVCPQCMWTLEEKEEGDWGEHPDRLMGRIDGVSAPMQPEQEPEYCDPSATIYKLAERVMSDCGHSTNNQRLLDRIADRIQRHIDATTPPAAPVAECVWEHEDSDYMPDTWKSGCGVLWTFTDGSPVENDMKYCCGCGAKLKENT